MTVLTYQFILFTLTAFNFLISARFSGAIVFGLIYSVVAILGVLADAVDFGRSTWIFREFASERIDKFQFISYWKSRFRKLFKLTAFLFLLFFIFRIQISFWILVLYPISWLMINYAQGYFNAKSDFHTAGFLNIAEKIIFAGILTMGYIFSIKPTFLLPIAIVGSLAFHSSLGALIVQNRLKVERLNDRNVYFKFDRTAANAMGVRSLLTDLLVLDLPVVNAFLGSQNAGLYGVGIKLRNPMTIGFTSVLTEIYPFVASNNFEKIHAVYKRSKLILFLNCFGIVIVAIFFQLGEVEKFFGKSYMQFATISMPILLANIFFGFISLKSGLMVARREEAKVLKLTLFTSLLLLTAIALAARFGDIQMVAWTYLIIMILNFLVFKSYKLMS